jgi:hypothetical protein
MLAFVFYGDHESEPTILYDMTPRSLLKALIPTGISQFTDHLISENCALYSC